MIGRHVGEIFLGHLHRLPGRVLSHADCSGEATAITVTQCQMRSAGHQAGELRTVLLLQVLVALQGLAERTQFEMQIRSGEDGLAEQLVDFRVGRIVCFSSRSDSIW